MSSRDVILARVRNAVSADGDPVVVPRDYDRGVARPASPDDGASSGEASPGPARSRDDAVDSDDAGSDDAGSDDAAGSGAMVDLLTERLTDYKAEVQRTGPDGVAAAVLAALATSGSVVVPGGLPGDLMSSLRDGGRRIVVDGDPADLSALELDDIDAVVTLATVAVAVNGTIVLDASPGQGRRIISLIPDLHVVVVRTEQVVASMPEAIGLLDPSRPTTMIAGPSATSDIELSRVEGVHGPRTLRVVIVDDGSRPVAV